MAQALMKRGKRTLARHIRSEYSRQAGQQQLNELLTYLLDPIKPIQAEDDTEIIDWLKWLVAGGESFQDFSKCVNQYSRAAICGLVWTCNFVAYRCRTCAASPCMSLCSECFMAGNHKDHDFNMFRSQAGGACDCGDTSVMDAVGFCPKHGPAGVKSAPQPPPDLVVMPEAMMPRLLMRLIHFLRALSSSSSSKYTFSPDTKAIKHYMEFLQSLVDIGTPIMSVMHLVLTDPNVYKTLNTDCDLFCGNRDEYAIFRSESFHLVREQMSTMNEYTTTRTELIDLAGIRKARHYDTMLQELMFWTVKYEFPQCLVTFLLTMLPIDEYKLAFTHAFVEHYWPVSLSLTRTENSETLSSQMLHVSVQLFSSETLVSQILREYRLIHVILLSVYNMLELVVNNCQLDDPERHYAQVVQCDSKAMRSHCYWSLASDLLSVLGLKSAALTFLRDPHLMNLWADTVALLQAMNVTERQHGEHVEYEANTYHAAFAGEFELGAANLWAVLGHLSPGQEHKLFGLKLVDLFAKALFSWFRDINFLSNTKLKVKQSQLTFHLPLHRHLALCASTAVQKLDVKPKLIIWPPDDHLHFLRMVAAHPLRLLSGVCEIMSNMWVKNGMEMRLQVITYLHYQFCNSMVDADMYLLQLVASLLNPNTFLRDLLQVYRVPDILTYGMKRLQDAEYHGALLEGALTTIALLLGVRTYLGISEEEDLRSEVLVLLCQTDRTHSSVAENVPEKNGITKQSSPVDNMLPLVANYSPPKFDAVGTLQQGTYSLKGDLWTAEFNPVMCVLRLGYTLSSLQKVMDRYKAHLKDSRNLWPPYRVPWRLNPAYAGLNQLLHARQLHGLLHTCLHKAVNDRLSEDTLSLVVHLLDMGVSLGTFDYPPTPKLPKDVGAVKHACAVDVEYTSWFPSDNLLLNLRHTVSNVTAVFHTEVRQVELGESIVSLLLKLYLKLTGGATLYSPVLTGDAAHVSTSTSSLPLSSQGAVGGKEDVVTTHPTPSSDAVLESGKRSASRAKVLHMSQASKTGRDHEASAWRDAIKKESRVGDALYFLTLLLNKIERSCSENAQHVRECNSELQPSVRQTPSKDEQRRKAKLRQQKLMNRLAHAQTKFAASNIDAGETSEDLRDGGPVSSTSDIPGGGGEKTFHCCSCNLEQSSTPDRPIVYMALLQNNSVLGFSLPQSLHSPWQLPVKETGERFPLDQIYLAYSVQRLKSLQDLYPLGQSQQTINAGWEAGLHVQVCSHAMHLDCYQKYLQSVQSSESDNFRRHKESDREFKCGLCRVMSNLTLPIPPHPSVTQVCASTKQGRAREIEGLLCTRPTDEESSYTKALDETFAVIQKSSGYLFGRQHLLMSDILWTNIEVEILQRGGSLVEQQRPGLINKGAVGSLWPVLGRHAKLKLAEPEKYRDLWARLTHPPHLTPSASSSSSKVPILLHDPVALLMQLLLQLPDSAPQEHVLTVVQAVYNVTYCLSLCRLACNFTEEERSAWVKRRKLEVATPLESDLRQTITKLRDGGMFEGEQQMLPFLSPVSQSVRTLMSVEAEVQASCLPLLRAASLILLHRFNVPLPTVQTREVEFKMLGRHLMLGDETPAASASTTSQATASPTTRPGSARDVLSSRYLCWLGQAGLEPWLHGVVPRSRPSSSAVVVSSGPAGAISVARHTRMVLLQPMLWHPPRLVGLPSLYSTLFTHYTQAKCRKCKTSPKDPAVCLICGECLCFKRDCCAVADKFEVSAHAETCGGGVGLFLLVESSLVLVFWGPRATLWGSVYLDSHGEEDQDLKRGKPLYLSMERYSLLQQQWLASSFPRTCERWIWHDHQF